MPEWLLNIDGSLFIFINSTLANPVTDFIMPVITNDNFLRVVYGLAIISILVFGKKRLLAVAIFSIFVLVLTDQSSSTFLKPFFERLRPCKVMEVHLLVGCGSGYSFPSSHAANIFGQAMFFGILYRRLAKYLVIFAFLVGVSRVFVGVHYPLDVVAGAILGTAMALGMKLVYTRYVQNSHILRGFNRRGNDEN